MLSLLKGKGAQACHGKETRLPNDQMPGKCNVLLFLMMEINDEFYLVLRTNSLHFSAGFGSPTEDRSEPTSGRNTALSKLAIKEKGSR